MSLLRRFKAARRRRDDAQYGSSLWMDADGENRVPATPDFDPRLEDQSSNVRRYEPDDDDTPR